MIFPLASCLKKETLMSEDLIRIDTRYTYMTKGRLHAFGKKEHPLVIYFHYKTSFQAHL